MAMRRAAALPGMVAGGRETPRAGCERDVEGETGWANSACDTLEPFRERQPVHRDAGAETTTSRREQQARARPTITPFFFSKAEGFRGQRKGEAFPEGTNVHAPGT